MMLPARPWAAAAAQPISRGGTVVRPADSAALWCRAAGCGIFHPACPLSGDAPRGNGSYRPSKYPSQHGRDERAPERNHQAGSGRVVNTDEEGIR